MSFSVDIVAIIVQCGFLLFFLGKFSEKISSLEKSNNKVIDKLDAISKEYVPKIDGARIDLKLDAAWVAIDQHKELLDALKNDVIKIVDEHKQHCTGYMK